MTVAVFYLPQYGFITIYDNFVGLQICFTIEAISDYYCFVSDLVDFARVFERGSRWVLQVLDASIN